MEECIPLKKSHHPSTHPHAHAPNWRSFQTTVVLGGQRLGTHGRANRELDRLHHSNTALRKGPQKSGLHFLSFVPVVLWWAWEFKGHKKKKNNRSQDFACRVFRERQDREMPQVIREAFTSYQQRSFDETRRRTEDVTIAEQVREGNQTVQSEWTWLGVLVFP